MKTTSTAEPGQDAANDLSPEYSFDYRKARPNRFAGRIDKSMVVVMLDPDIAEVLCDSGISQRGPARPHRNDAANAAKGQAQVAAFAVR